MKNEMTKLNGRAKVEYPLKQGLKHNPCNLLLPFLLLLK